VPQLNHFITLDRNKKADVQKIAARDSAFEYSSKSATLTERRKATIQTAFARIKSRSVLPALPEVSAICLVMQIAADENGTHCMTRLATKK
jgi:hypothetical protein